jgi:hypothetical protein
MNRKQRRKGGRNGGIVPPHVAGAIASARGGNAASGAPRKSLTLGMGGFDGLINALGRVPLDVNRALPLIESGDVAKASTMLTDALIKVELGKASILGNLALAAMKAGDISAATGYVDIALESLTELGLEGTELGKMLALVLANLPSDPAPATTAGDALAATVAGDAPAPTAGDAPAPTAVAGDTTDGK